MKYFIEIVCFLIVIYELILIKLDKLILLDKIIIYLALIGQSFVYMKYVFDIKIIGYIPHYLFWIVLILIVSFSKNNYLLFLGLICLLLTFITRFLLNECLFYSKYEKKNKDISKKATIMNVTLLILIIIKLIHIN